MQGKNEDQNDSFEEDFDFEKFIKEGGIDLELLDQSTKEEMKRKETISQNNKMLRKGTIWEIEGKENMAGFLYRDKEKLEARSRLKDIVNIVTALKR